MSRQAASLLGMTQRAAVSGQQIVASFGEREISSRAIGEMVMAELYKLDKVGYIRFASVYKSFQDVSDFREVIREVEPKPAKRKAPKPEAGG